MKKLLIASGVILTLITACNNSKKETTEAEPTNSSVTTEAERREKEIDDSTIMLDKQLADPNYMPDSLKN